MSETSKGLLTKLTMTFIFGVLTFALINDSTLLSVFIVTSLITAMNYLLGDRMLMPRFGNLIALISDCITGIFIAYIGAVISVSFKVTSSSLVLFALLTGIGEYFFHRYLDGSKKVEP